MSIVILKNDSVFVFGGSTNHHGDSFYYSNSNGNQIFNDLWRFDSMANIWYYICGNYSTNNVPNVINLGGYNFPGSRAGGAFFSLLNESMFIFGGVGPNYNQYNNDVWRFDIDTALWFFVQGSPTPNSVGINGTYPTGLALFSSCMVINTNIMYIYGGNFVGYLNQLWKYDADTNNFTFVAGNFLTNQGSLYQGFNSLPAQRIMGSLISLSNNSLLLFSGQGGSIPYLNDIWIYETVCNPNYFGPQ